MAERQQVILVSKIGEGVGRWLAGKMLWAPKDTSGYVVQHWVATLADCVYDYAMKTSVSPIERLFCLPVAAHQTCAQYTNEPQMSFVQLGRQAASQAGGAVQVFLEGMDPSELVVIAKYLASIGKATIEQDMVRHGLKIPVLRC